MKKILRYLIFFLIAAGFIYLATKKIDPQKLWDDIKQADLRWVGLAIVAGMISNLSRSARWLIIAEPLGYKPKFSNSYHGVMISYLVNFLIPRGGELARASVVSKVEKIPIATMIGSVVAERVTDLLCMLVVLLVAFGVQYDTLMAFIESSSKDSAEDSGFPWIKLILAVMAVGGIVFLLIRKKLNHIKLFKRINDLFDGFVEGVKGLTRIKRPIPFIIHSVVIWVMYYLMVYFCFFSIPATSHLGFSAGLTVLVTSTLAIIIPAPGGTGTFQYFVPIALTLYGVTEDGGGTSYAFIAHGSQMIMFITFGLISMIYMILAQRKALTE